MGRTRVVVRTAVIIGALAIAFPSAARAGSITITNIDHFNGVGTGYFFTPITYPTDPAAPGYDPALAGQPLPLGGNGVPLGSVSMSGGVDLNADLNAPKEFEAYCVDILGEVDFRETDNDGVVSPPVQYTATADEMTNWVAPSALNSDEARERAAWLYNTYADTFTSGQLLERTALQMAIWEVLYDETPDVSMGSGRFYVNSANADVANLTTVYLQNLLNPANAAAVAASNAAWIRMEYSDGRDAQDFIGPGSSTNAVPEPGSLLLLGTGLAALTAFRRKSLRG